MSVGADGHGQFTLLRPPAAIGLPAAEPALQLLATRRITGYAIAFLFPQIGDWTWQQIGDLRRDRSMAYFRAKLREIEDEAAANAQRRRPRSDRPPRI